MDLDMDRMTVSLVLTEHLSVDGENVPWKAQLYRLFSAGGVIFSVNAVNERDFSLLITTSLSALVLAGGVIFAINAVNERDLSLLITIPFFVCTGSSLLRLSMNISHYFVHAHFRVPR